MIEHKQIYFHRPEQNEIGDCFRTCIACLLDLSNPEEIPHYYLNHWNPDPALDIFAPVLKETNKFLREKFGVIYKEYPIEVNNTEQLETYINWYYPDTHIILGCSSKNGGHVVIRKGPYMWDPAKDNSGCVGPARDGYYWIGFLMKVGKE